jgi:hypothetical protein
MRIVRVEEMIYDVDDIEDGLMNNAKLVCKLENKATRLDSQSRNNAIGVVPSAQLIFDGYIETDFFLGAQRINIR